jgi:hypothetical protein
LKLANAANVCWYRFDDEFVPDWYLDSGATDHITSELEKLTMHDCYNGNDQIHVANGADMDIVYVGNSVLPTSS